MSKTIRGEKGAGYEYWSSRPYNYGGASPGKKTKKITHRLERAEKKRLIQKEIKRVRREQP